METIRCLTMANKNSGGLNNLLHSFDKVKNWDVQVIGKNCKWGGWRTRMQTYADSLRDISPNDIVVLVDAYDVLCIRSGLDFDKTFRSFGVDLVISAENHCGVNCTPLTRWWYSNPHVFPKGPRNANCGMMAGTAAALLELWEWCLLNNYKDDQIALGCYMNSFPSRCTLDVHSQLFYNDVGGKSKFSISNGRISLGGRETSPYFIHFPGHMNRGSISFLTQLFESSSNYEQLNKDLIGFDYIPPPVNRTVFFATLWAERSLYFCIMLTLVAVIFRLTKSQSKVP